MRVAAIYDIHANLPALEAVLEEIDRAGADRIVVGGDVVPGPLPRETLNCLRHLRLPASFVRGNGEREIAALLAGEETRAPEAYREAMHWVAREVGAEEAEWMRRWEATIHLEIPPLGQVLFCHATPRSDSEIFLGSTPEEVLRPVFDPLGADLVVCGHTHMQFDRQVGRTRIVNAGSVGMPFGHPGACWLMLGPEVELRRTGYDLEAAARRIRESRYPLAREFADREILRPRPEKEMLELFAKAELRG